MKKYILYSFLVWTISNQIVAAFSPFKKRLLSPKEKQLVSTTHSSQQAPPLLSRFSPKQEMVAEKIPSPRGLASYYYKLKKYRYAQLSSFIRNFNNYIDECSKEELIPIGQLKEQNHIDHIIAELNIYCETNNIPSQYNRYLVLNQETGKIYVARSLKKIGFLTSWARHAKKVIQKYNYQTTHASLYEKLKAKVQRFHHSIPLIITNTTFLHDPTIRIKTIASLCTLLSKAIQWSDIEGALEDLVSLNTYSYRELKTLCSKVLLYDNKKLFLYTHNLHTISPALFKDFKVSLKHAFNRRLEYNSEMDFQPPSVVDDLMSPEG